MWGKGIVRMRWLNWIVFDHLLIMMAQSVKKSMSPRRRCLDGSNCVNPLHSKFALRRRPKKATRQTAQNVTCEGLSKFKWLLKANRIWGVIGFFWDTVKPFTRLIPRSAVASWKLFLLGQSVHVQGVECELHLNKLGWRMLRVTLLGKLHSD